MTKLKSITTKTTPPQQQTKTAIVESQLLSQHRASSIKCNCNWVIKFEYIDKEKKDKIKVIKINPYDTINRSQKKKTCDVMCNFLVGAWFQYNIKGYMITTPHINRYQQITCTFIIDCCTTLKNILVAEGKKMQPLALNHQKQQAGLCPHMDVDLSCTVTRCDTTAIMSTVLCLCKLQRKFMYFKLRNILEKFYFT